MRSRGNEAAQNCEVRAHETVERRPYLRVRVPVRILPQCYNSPPPGCWHHNLANFQRQPIFTTETTEISEEPDHKPPSSVCSVPSVGGTTTQDEENLMQTNTTKAKLAEGKVVFGAIINRYAPD